MKMLLVLLVSVLAFVVAEDNTGLHIVNRREWGAYRPRHTPKPLQTLPPNYVIISHTASGICMTKDKCIFHVRNLQDLHTKQYGWYDIGPNFLVGGDGNVYEGRGWDVEGSLTKTYNKKSIGIALIGDFTYKSPSQAQIDATKNLLEYGLKNNNLAKGYKLLGQRQVSEHTQSPGNKLFEIIKSWDHWSESP